MLESSAPESSALEPSTPDEAPPSIAAAAPLRPPYWREVAVTAPAIFGLILGVSALLGPVLERLPELAATAVTVVLVVMAMTNPVMPVITRVFRRFLFPVSGPDEQATGVAGTTRES